MLYGELGLLPLKLNIQKRLIGYWGKLITSPTDRISKIMYDILFNESTHKGYKFAWLNYVEKLLNECGHGYVWLYQNQISTFFSEDIYQRLYDISLQQIKEACSHSHKGSNYLILKSDWRLEKYFKQLDYKEAINIFKYRTANHRLPIETGRFYATEYENRICPKCSNDIGDEFHYLLKCTSFNTQRRKFIKASYIRHPNMISYKQLLHSCDTRELTKLSRFVTIIMQKIVT